jgi:hypothetical protein
MYEYLSVVVVVEVVVVVKEILMHYVNTVLKDPVTTVNPRMVGFNSYSF